MSEPKKVVVIGASSGLGRCLAIGLGQRGARVAALARRHDRVTDTASESGPGALAIACDATDEQSCKRAIDEAAESLGGIDALVYAAGMGRLHRLVDTDAATWRATFDTNVVGAALATATAVPHLEASSGSALFLSSVSTSVTPPWPGLGAYLTTKAALDKLVEAWQVEHPGVAFTRVVVGNCGGGQGASVSEFTTEWDTDLAGDLLNSWIAKGYLDGLLDVEDLISVVDTVIRLRAVTWVPSVTVAPRSRG